MRRLMSFVLASIVAVSSAAVSSPHVHAYGGHDHPEHQHGPASHRHDNHHNHDVSQAAATHDRHEQHDRVDLHDRLDAHGAHLDAHEDGREAASVRIEACDPGGHVIEIPGAAAPAPQAHVQLAVLSAPIILAPAAPARLASAPLDVRVHGPPHGTRLPARAPPLTLLA